MEVKIGDWVSFYSAGRIVIGKVEYLRKGRPAQRYIEVCTTAGATLKESILERRRDAQQDAGEQGSAETPQAGGGGG